MTSKYECNINLLIFNLSNAQRHFKNVLFLPKNPSKESSNKLWKGKKLFNGKNVRNITKLMMKNCYKITYDWKAQKIYFLNWKNIELFLSVVLRAFSAFVFMFEMCNKIRFLNHSERGRQSEWVKKGILFCDWNGNSNGYADQIELK